MADGILRTIADVGEAYDRGLSPVSLVQNCLDRIEGTNSVFNAMLFVDRDEVLAEAGRVEAEIGSGYRKGPLHGVPIAVKDVIDVKGWPTTCGSKLFEANVAEEDAVCVKRLRDAGAIIIGKTNLHELTAGTHDNPWLGKVVNPLSSEYGTGGTSSGSAAAVSAGYCVAALGTDTGGSNRSTAAATGLIGYKPKNGVIENLGVWPTAPSLDTIGPIASSVDDVWIVHQALKGEGDLNLDRVDLSGLRIGLCEDFSASLDPAVQHAHERWMQQAADSGVKFVEARFALAEELKDAGLAILTYEFAKHYHPLVDKAPENVSDQVKAFIAQGMKVNDNDYREALGFRNHARAVFDLTFSNVDLLASPVAPGLAPRLTDEMTQVGPDHVPYGLAGGVFRRWANVVGLPSLALPLHIAGSLPASIQICSISHSERQHFAACKALGQLS